MEADVEPSKETEERLKAEAEAERQKAAAIAAEAARREAEAAAEQARAAALLADLQNQQEVCHLHNFQQRPAHNRLLNGLKFA